MSRFSVQLHQSLAVAAACTLSVLCLLQDSHSTTVYYTPFDPLSDTIPVNPERGLYTQFTTHAGDYQPLDQGALLSVRKDGRKSLILRLIYLDTLIEQDLPASLLLYFAADMDAVRAAGIKVILRFAYSESLPDPEDGPYGDASPARVLAHIAQLKPALMAAADVIAVVQAGLVGVWGEWYYTDTFGDPRTGPPTAQNWGDRASVTAALLDALPNSRSVQVRTPEIKRKVSGQTTPVSESDALAENRPAVARLGHHNDCFLASVNDFSTYTDLAVDYDYLSRESRYLPVGGETCAVNPPRSDCAKAEEELELFHWSYLNAGYHRGVWQSWTDAGCASTITSRLGYQLELLNAEIPDTAVAGSTMELWLNVRNNGYAAPFNPRLFELMLRNVDDGNACSASLPVDVRTWLPGSQLVVVTATLPDSIHPGRYDMLLSLSAPEASLRHRPEYKVALYNQGTFEETTGLVHLRHVVKVIGPETNPVVDATVPTLTCSATLPFLPPPTTNALESAPNQVQDPSFGEVSAWHPYGIGYLTVAGVSYSGVKSIRVSNGGGASQQVALNDPRVISVTISGWSMASKAGPAGSARTSDYSVYTDTAYTEGPSQWGEVAPFSHGTHGWEQASHTFSPTDTSETRYIATVAIFALYRNLPGGAAWFDDLSLTVRRCDEHEWYSTAANSCNQAFVEDGALEAPSLPAWTPFLSGYEVVSGAACRGGDGSCARVTSDGGLTQVVSITADAARSGQFVISGWSKASGVPAGTTANYAIYADVHFSEGGSEWGKVAMFNGGDHDWEFASLAFYPAGTSDTRYVTSVNLYVLFRGGLAGEVHFDDIQVQTRRAVSTVTAPVRCPVGYYPDPVIDGTCLRCPAGHFCGDSSAETSAAVPPTLCADGEYSSGGETQCTPCSCNGHGACSRYSGVCECSVGYSGYECHDATGTNNLVDASGGSSTNAPGSRFSGVPLFLLYVPVVGAVVLAVVLAAIVARRKSEAALEGSRASAYGGRVDPPSVAVELEEVPRAPAPERGRVKQSLLC